MGIPMNVFPGVYIFTAGILGDDGVVADDKYVCFSEEYVKNCVYNVVSSSSNGINVDMKQGERAFLHEIVDLIRRDNILRQM